MGFNQYRYGNIHACWVQDGYVCQEMACTHEVHKYRTRLQIDIPKQTNVFVSFTVAFLLYHEDKMYVGRHDGSISIYRTSDRMLVGINNWDPAMCPPVATVGFFNSPDGLFDVYLDMRDRRTLYLKWRNLEASLEKPFQNDFTDIFNFDDYQVASTMDGWSIYTKGGERIGVNVWSVQDELRRRDCEVFL